MIEDKSVVVTGAGHGIGRALAARMARAAARVVVNDIDAEAAQQVADEVGGCAIACDVASEAGVSTLIDRAIEQHGDIDIWFANAGIDRGRGLATAEADWISSMDINVLSHVRAARLLMPRWIERGSGRFVVTASAAGVLTLLDGPAYSVTKHAAVAFAEWLSVTYRHRGVTVQALCPQGVNTQMLQQSGPLKDILSHDTALEPEEVADIVHDALGTDEFFIFPHAEVATYYAKKAATPDRWLGMMNGLQQRLESAKRNAEPGP